MFNERDFLPVSRSDMERRGWDAYDILLVTGDAYVDHPAFGAAVIGRVLEARGYRVAVLAQPDWHDASAFAAMGRPRLGVFIGAGNLDSMVAHYTVAKKRRGEDFYSPARKSCLRPDRATIVYANRAREAFPGIKLLIGGLEASLRRFAHYDYWDDRVRRSILLDAGADILIYGMGETATAEAARRMAAGESLAGIPGSCIVSERAPKGAVVLPGYEQVSESKRLFAEATATEYREHDPIRGRTLAQPHGEKLLLCYPPAMPLSTEELDAVAELPYTREVHPMYAKLGGVPAIDEVRFSVTHNRGCFGGCAFCAIAFHQGRMVTARSQESVIREVEAMTHHPLWKGFVSDVGGPTANFRHASCRKQLTKGMCPDRRCLAPTPCPNLDADHSDYVELLQRLRAVPGVKKVFVRSGVRYDYVLCDKQNEFLPELVRYHVSGQLRVAPEHCVERVLACMGKPPIEVYDRFMERYSRVNEKYGKAQFVVPYLMSSHPGSTLNAAIELAMYLKHHHARPEQVQDFYPTPGTISTCMYYTGLDPMTMQSVYVPRSPQEKAMQRALLQYSLPQNAALVRAALLKAGRGDLIGTGKGKLIAPEGYTPREKRGTPPGKRPAQGKTPSARPANAKSRTARPSGVKPRTAKSAGRGKGRA